MLCSPAWVYRLGIQRLGRLFPNYSIASSVTWAISISQLQERKVDSYHTSVVLIAREPKVHSRMSCEFRSSVICMGSVKVHLATSPTWGQCAGEWGDLTSISCHGWLWQKHLLQHSTFWQKRVFSRYKTTFQHLLSLLSAAVNADLRVREPWALSWWCAAASLLHCAEGSMALQRIAIHCNAKSLAQGSTSLPPYLLVRNISPWHFFHLSS